MKLIIAIVRDDDSAALLDALGSRRLGATKLASTGGFLREGNTTVLIGVEDERTDEVLDIIRHTCPRRSKVAPQFLPENTQMMPPVLPVNIETGGATVFVVPIDQFIHF